METFCLEIVEPDSFKVYIYVYIYVCVCVCVCVYKVNRNQAKFISLVAKGLYWEVSSIISKHQTRKVRI